MLAPRPSSTGFHGRYAWKKLRRVARLQAGFRCSQCGRLEPHGLHVHHVKPVATSPAVALEPLNLQVLCGPCHNALEPRSGSRGLAACSIDGVPLDPRHPWNVQK